ncbi:MAG: hypothetical protein ACLQL2_08875 [Methylovirgula sp.]
MLGKRAKSLTKTILAILTCACAATLFPGLASAAPKTKFWNITGDTVVKFELALAGTTKWGPDQCKNDSDDSVDDDERLTVKDVASGTYDARLTYKDGGVCFAKSVKVVEGKIFSIEKKELTGCTKPR